VREYDLTVSASSDDKFCGAVIKYDPMKGYGFLRRDGGGHQDAFVHVREVEKVGRSALTRGQRIAFDVVPGPRGPRAVDIEVLS
jgi:CspA family cold shock protein